MAFSPVGVAVLLAVAVRLADCQSGELWPNQPNQLGSVLTKEILCVIMMSNRSVLYL
jgi:hypothetical protein